jgi:hypothetical protein
MVKALKGISKKKEIIYNLINSGLAGFLVLLGAFSTGNVDMEAFFTAGIAALIVAVSQFKKYWDGEKVHYQNKIFSFVPL